MEPLIHFQAPKEGSNIDKSLKEQSPEMYAEYFQEKVDKLESIMNLDKYRMELYKWKREELLELCRYKRIQNYSKLSKPKLIKLLINHKMGSKKVNLVEKKQGIIFDFDDFVGIKDVLPKE